MRPLPPLFLAEMHDLFEAYGRLTEWPAFLESFNVRPAAGLRANALKISAPELKALLAAEPGLDGDAIRPVPWSADGFYLPSDAQPGRLPWHSAGLYYIQEPSAMLPAAVLNARPGERVLDLCAAPGGKSCRIAADLQGEGLLWANEISADRARALLHNIELTGCRNSLITQETPERLAACLPFYFDKILVDAPCSGSGMFRRDPSAMDSWQAYGSEHCTELQRGILDAAWAMLRPGGTLVYSTCTFSIAEDEGMIGWMLEQHPDCRILPIAKSEGVSDGLPLTPEMTRTARIWPHLAEGDGHFCAMLSKLPDEPAASHPDIMPVAANGETTAAWLSFDRFCQAALSEQGLRNLSDYRARAGHRFERSCLHLLPPGIEVPLPLKKLKTGLFLGQVKMLRDKTFIFEPSQAFLFSLKAGDLAIAISDTESSGLIRRYLRGETVTCSDPDRYQAGRYAGIMMNGGGGAWPLGWGKTMGGGLVKNLYPQAWRRQI